MSPPTLRQLCTAAAIRNVKYLNDIGNIPYALARPFLLKIESPEKLRSLELQSPHLMNDDAELWLEFIKRDIPNWDEYQLPEQPDCWYGLYCELREEVQRGVDEDAEKLKMALDGLSSERAKHSTKFVADRRTIGVPRSRTTARHRFSTFGSFTPKKNNIFSATRRNNALTVPTKQLNNRATQVRQAPRSLIEEHRRPAEPAVARRPPLRAPGRSSLQYASSTRSHSSPAGHSSSLQEREARLRAITSGHIRTPSRPHTPLQASSSERPAPTRTSSGVLPASSESQLSATTNSEVSGMSPPRAVIRKRPAPNLFIQPKKKKV
ncbi:RNA polymerase II transcription factor SIII subunit A-domain-containing protein, partial [Aspergillus fruticulosus]